jgi:hypothetical protein
MMIFSKAGLAFLSVPKTGTTAYQAALRDHADLVVTGPPDLKHAPLYRYNRFIRPMYEKVCRQELEVLAVMREPISWLGSWYRYRQRPALQGHRNSTAGLSFDEFVLAYCDPSPPAFANVGRQSKFLEPRPNGVAASHLFAYENQPGILAFLNDRLGVTITLPAINVSPHAALQLSPEVADALYAAHPDEFALYGSIVS